MDVDWQKQPIDLVLEELDVIVVQDRLRRGEKAEIRTGSCDVLVETQERYWWSAWDSRPEPESNSKGDLSNHGVKPRHASFWFKATLV